MVLGEIVFRLFSDDIVTVEMFVTKVKLEMCWVIIHWTHCHPSLLASNTEDLSRVFRIENETTRERWSEQEQPVRSSSGAAARPRASLNHDRRYYLSRGRAVHESGFRETSGIGSQMGTGFRGLIENRAWAGYKQATTRDRSSRVV